jgi:hypothetical protein
VRVGRRNAARNEALGVRRLQKRRPGRTALCSADTNFDFHVAMQEVRLYPDKKTAMTVSVHLPGGNPGTLSLAVSGQLV